METTKKYQRDSLTILWNPRKCRIGIKKAILNTTNAYTASQTLVDAPSKKEPRMGRGAAINSAPAATGADIEVTKVNVPPILGSLGKL